MAGRESWSITNYVRESCGQSLRDSRLYFSRKITLLPPPSYVMRIFDKFCKIKKFCGSSFSNISRGEFDAYDTFLIPLANKINKNLEIYFLL